MAENGGISPEPGTNPLNPRAQLRILGGTELKSAEDIAINEVLRRPKRLALLAYLALATPFGFHRRDSIVGLFWPELDQERGRAALRQAIHGLEKAMGEGTIQRRGAGEIALDLSRVWCDAIEFERALTEKRITDALSLYRGDALVGLYVPGSGQELDEWMMRARERLRSSAVNAALKLARESLSHRERNATGQWAEWAIQHSPDDEKVAREAMGLLAGSGDRAGALRAYEHFASRLRAELEAEPSPETIALANAIRNEKRDAEIAFEIERPAAEISESTPVAASSEGHTRSRRNYLWPSVGIAAAIAVITIASSSNASMMKRFEGQTVLAGPVFAQAGSGVDDIARILPAMLTEKIARNHRIHVVERMRVLEIHAEQRRSPDSLASALKAAQAAGADIVLTGNVRKRGDGLLLAIRGIDPQGRKLIEIEIAGKSSEELTSRIAGDRPRRANQTNSAGNIRAWRLYEDGLRELASGDVQSARTLLTESYAIDSAHALTAYYMDRAIDPAGEYPSTEWLRRAVRFATGASPVDRLRILARWAEATNDPLSGLLADSLLYLAPDDPHAIYASALAKIRSGDFLVAARRLIRVVELDSTSRLQPSETCLACRALKTLAATYHWVDSTEAAVRTQRQLAEWQPGDPENWRALSIQLARLGRFGEADIARKHALAIRPQDSATIAMDDAMIAFLREDYRTSDAAFERILASSRSTQDERADAMWWLSISLRQQGRARASLAMLRRMRVAENVKEPNPAVLLHEAQINAELGQWPQAYILFDSASRLPSQGADLAASYGRHRAWTLTQVARARVALRDTIGLAALADTVRNLGAMSMYGRDWKLHYFIRGLALEARGDTTAAITAYRRSIYSPTFGFTCSNVYLARLLIAQNRPRDAADVLRPALHGGRDASNLYVTATEIHELLGKAFDLAHARDSALVHYRAVAQAWRGAENPWRKRGEIAAKRAAALQSQI